MKKIVYALVLAILLPLFSANAEKLSVPAQINNNSLKNFKVTKEMLLTPRVDFMSNKNNNALQANEYFTKTVASTPMGWWIGYGAVTTPMVYDPQSNILIYSTYKTGTKGADLYCTINLFWTNDLGENWSKDTLGAFTNEILVSPSIGVTNTNNATTIQELNIVNYSRYAAKLGTDYPWAGAYFQLRKAGEYEPWSTTGPEIGENASFYSWPSCDFAVYKNNNQTAATAVGVLGTDKNDLAKYGIYGQASINIDSYDYTFSLPNEWAAENFWIYQLDFNSSYNSRMLTDADNSGNVYAAVYNFCVNNDKDSTRTPAVSKSTDGGATWGTLNLCPAKVIADYMTANNFYYRWPDHPDVSPQMVGGLVNASLGSFTKNGFVATGNNEYSFITPFWCVYQRNDSLLAKTRMVEIYYKNNTWGVNTVGDLKYNGVPQEAYTVTDASGARMYDTLDANADGYEVCAAKTADGNDIVCTWVSNSKIYVFNPPFESSIYGQIDSIWTTDIFGGVRSLSGNSWTAVQFTDDDHYNKLTRLPKVVPNRNAITLIAHNTLWSTNETVWNTYPEQFQNMNYRSFQAFYMLPLDFSKPSKFWPGGGDVQDPASSIFTLNAPVPNPANVRTELTFNMIEGANTNISVFNAMGAKVADLQNGYTSEGIHGLFINTESYPSGVYYIVLSAGSNSATTILNVVR
jgi:hypothetical protein